MPVKLEPIDLTSIAKSYRDKWVALSEDMKKVYASGNNPKDVQKKAAEKGHSEAIITKLPAANACMIF